jgi:hypothetical protein
MRPSDWYWLCWLLLGFGVPELVAIFTGHRECTLSYSVWRLRDLCPIGFAAFWLALVSWLTYHFLTGKTGKETDKDEQR